jgi:hypothetical protein
MGKRGASDRHQVCEAKLIVTITDLKVGTQCPLVLLMKAGTQNVKLWVFVRMKY